MSAQVSPTAESVENALSIKGLTVHFGGLYALRDVSFDVVQGETFGIIGPNGAGKTTLLNAVSALVRTSGGSITFQSQDITSVRTHRIAALGVGRSFQLAEGFTHFSVWDYVRLGRAAVHRQGWLKPELTSAFDEGSRRALDRFDLTHLKNTRMGLLPYGIRKMVDISRVMAGEPSLLLLDEPTSGLSREERSEMTRHVQTLADEGRTVVVVDHDVGFISEVANNALALAYGETMCTGSLSDVLAHPGVMNSYLGIAKEV
ncbi:MAG TPA: ATP-binding cassette domain-containing protein [Acidimicrobiales bacterium]|nr:ATP-binding cassette domain-containing protein [Acidimicrobiales bacterium]